METSLKMRRLQDNAACRRVVTFSVAFPYSCRYAWGRFETNIYDKVAGFKRMRSGRQPRVCSCSSPC
ncbi:hypothetical protein MPLSOD_340165 [Mesorhizobium sp. SOD10]|nr:hypothetical protein MPLSOD_340165 [Mesorhizobium sp. SOD10]